MRVTTFNYRRDGSREYRIHRAWTVRDIPRWALLLCRLFGHRPVTAGFDSKHIPPSRWVECRRCGSRPQWQGRLSALAHPHIGKRYRGQWAPDDTADLILRAGELTHPRYKIKDDELPSLPCKPWSASPRRATFRTELSMRRRWLRDGLLDLTFRFTTDAYDGGMGIWLTIGPLFISADLEHAFERFHRWLKHGSLDEREFEVGIRGWTLHLTPWGVAHSWTRADPWWKRGVSIDLKDRILGRPIYTTVTVEEPTSVIVPMPEGPYAATITLERAMWERPRLTRLTRNVVYRYDLTPAHHIPAPGKGENSWDCGDDGTWSISGPCAGPDTEWKAKAVGDLVASCLRSRERYASSSWVPDAGWPSEDERLGRVPA
jgi:hypothetical protein